MDWFVSNAEDAVDMIMAGKVPLISFEDTYEMHRLLVIRGLQFKSNHESYALENFSYRVHHGLFITHNDWFAGQYVPRSVVVH